MLQPFSECVGLTERQHNVAHQHRKNVEKTLTALTALVLWRNNYCLRTKMYIVAHDDVSVDNCCYVFCFVSEIIIIFYLILSLNNLKLYVKKTYRLT